MNTLTDGAPEPPPNSWTVVHEYSKSVVTLASALLALTVTFSEKILNHSRPDSKGGFLIFAWIALLCSISSGLLTAAFVSNHLAKFSNSGDEEGIDTRGIGSPPAEPAERGTRWSAADKAILCSNTAFFCLMLSAVGFLALGLQHITGTPKRSIPRVVSSSIAVMDSIHPSRKWEFVSMASLKGDTVKLVLASGTDTVNLKVTSGKIDEIVPTP